MFDPRIESLVPFVPHAADNAIRALPTGSYDAAMDANVQKRFARITDTAFERLTYTVDGDTHVTGVIVRPAETRAGAHPIVIFNRGGSGHSGVLVLPVILRYMLPFAQSGYLVFGSNYRGNDGGSGEEQFGGSDVGDILTLIDIAKQHPGWDGKNIFMLGGSRGGMMTYLSIKHGAVLNAAATFGGISDVSLGDGRWKELLERFYNRLPQPRPSMATMIAERSAILWTDKLATTPLLLMHGLADDVVPPLHTQRLAEALGHTNATFETEYYEGGNHSLSTHSAAMMARVKAWFERFSV
jgi:dipeptidyl aminopeptidase/acylaminoacyl peptidase